MGQLQEAGSAWQQCQVAPLEKSKWGKGNCCAAVLKTSHIEQKWQSTRSHIKVGKSNFAYDSRSYFLFLPGLHARLTFINGLLQWTVYNVHDLVLKLMGSTILSRGYVWILFGMLCITMNSTVHSANTGIIAVLFEEIFWPLGDCRWRAGGNVSFSLGTLYECLFSYWYPPLPPFFCLTFKLDKGLIMDWRIPSDAGDPAFVKDICDLILDSTYFLLISL